MKWRTASICVALLVTGSIIAWGLVATKPTARRTPPPVSSQLVSTVSASVGNADLTVKALGTIKPAQETVVRSRVSGQVESLGKGFEVGGLLEAGALLLQIDSADYKNTLALEQSALDKAKADYDLEMGQQKVARTEIEQLNKSMPGAVQNASLALREPQLAQARATLEAAKTDVEQAKLNLERTKIVAPYNAMVTARGVSLGSQASLSDALATLVGTDEYYIEAAIPLDKLYQLGLKTFDGAPVKIFSGSGEMREGSVVYTIGTLDDTTRMARVLISVPDPLGLKNDVAALFLGDQAYVEMVAGTLDDVVELPRAALRGGDTVWIAMPAANGAYTLDVRNVNAVWRDTETTFIRDSIKEGELIITSVLGAPVQGMPLRLVSTNQSTQTKQVQKNIDTARPNQSKQDEKRQPAASAKERTRTESVEESRP